jgi:putative ABC transport system permease protein
MSINVLERTREIGVMRAIGASNGSIRTIVVIEGVLIGAISWLVGALLSLPFSYGIVALLSTALRFEVFYAFSVFGLVIWLAIVIGIPAIASVFPAWNASRPTVREVLAYG